MMFFFYFFIISFSYKDKNIKKGSLFTLYDILFFFSYFLNNKKNYHLPFSIYSSLYFVHVFCALKTTPKQSQNDLRCHRHFFRVAATTPHRRSFLIAATAFGLS